MKTKLTTLSPNEIHDLCAEIQGWHEVNLSKIFSEGWDEVQVKFWHDGANNTGYSSSMPNESFDEPFDDYQPTADTTEGKAQVFDLMVKFITEPKMKNTLLLLVNSETELQLAICHAAILSVLGEDYE